MRGNRGNMRGAFRGGRGGHPAARPVFAQYSSSPDYTAAADNKTPSVAESDIIPFNVVSPDILRVKGGAASSKFSLNLTDASQK